MRSIKEMLKEEDGCVDPIGWLITILTYLTSGSAVCCSLLTSTGSLFWDHTAMMANTPIEFLNKLKKRLEEPDTYLV